MIYGKFVSIRYISATSLSSEALPMRKLPEKRQKSSI